MNRQNLKSDRLSIINCEKVEKMKNKFQKYQKKFQKTEI